VCIGKLAKQAAGYHDRERAEQPEGEPVLAARLAASDHRRQENPRGQVRGRDEEDCELHVPGAHKVERECPCEIESEETAEVGPVVL
jgi:hypothetical protein